MEKIIMKPGRPVSVKSVMTYADALRIINWMVKNLKWAQKVILKKIVSVDQGLIPADKITEQAYLIAGIPLEDIYYDENPTGCLYTECCDNCNECCISIPHFPTKEELTEAYMRLDGEIEHLYRLKEKAVRVLRPPVVGIESIKGQSYKIVDVEELYRPHVPITREEYEEYRKEYPVINSGQAEQNISNSFPRMVDDKEYEKALSVIKRLTGEE